MEAAKKKRGKKQKKIYLQFNEEKRKEFLTGFHQRKLERKRKAKEELEKRKKEEKKKLKEERKNIMQEMYLSQRTVPEIEHLVEPVTYELPEHTVTVTSVDDIDFIGHDGTRLGKNKFEYCSDQEDENNSETTTKKLSQNMKDLKNVTKKLKKQKYLVKKNKRVQRGIQTKKHSKQHMRKREKKAKRFNS